MRISLYTGVCNPAILQFAAIVNAEQAEEIITGMLNYSISGNYFPLYSVGV